MLNAGTARNETARRLAFWQTLLSWHSKNARDYPWRNATDPFQILLAELLLQQTHVRAVEVVYAELLQRYPSAKAVSAAPIEDLSGVMRPLGLYYRVHRLRAIGHALEDEWGGEVPDSYEALASLPGVGQYITNAVLCYAFGQSAVPIDTNVIRVFGRYFGLDSGRKRPREDKKLGATIRSLFPYPETRAANLAVLDFGGLICTSVKPRCSDCPLGDTCPATYSTSCDTLIAADNAEQIFGEPSSRMDEEL